MLTKTIQRQFKVLHHILIFNLVFTIIPSIEQDAIALIVQQLLAEVFVERQEGIGGVVQEELEPSVKLVLEEVYLAEFFCVGWLIARLIGW